MKALRKLAYYGIVSTMFLIVAINSATLLRKVSSGADEITLKVKLFPSLLLADEIRNANAVRIIFIYSQQDCQECVASYLRMLRETTNHLHYKAVQVIACGEFAGDRFSRSARVYHLDFSLIETSEATLLDRLPGLEIPAIVLIDGNNQIISCRRADPLHIRSVAGKITRSSETQAPCPCPQTPSRVAASVSNGAMRPLESKALGAESEVWG